MKNKVTRKIFLKMLSMLLIYSGRFEICLFEVFELNYEYIKAFMHIITSVFWMMGVKGHPNNNTAGKSESKPVLWRLR
jgi:hypothetical protein